MVRCGAHADNRTVYRKITSVEADRLVMVSKGFSGLSKFRSPGSVTRKVSECQLSRPPNTLKLLTLGRHKLHGCLVKKHRANKRPAA
jgi:hypothetical protein